MPQPRYPRERPGTHCTGGWVGPRDGLDVCKKSRPHRDSIPRPSSLSSVTIPTELPVPCLFMCAWSKFFYCGLFNYAVSSSGFIPRNFYMIIERRNAKYLEESGWSSLQFNSPKFSFFLGWVSLSYILKFPQFSVQIFCSQKRVYMGILLYNFF
jgi:hypothetical protein